MTHYSLLITHCLEKFARREILLATFRYSLNAIARLEYGVSVFCAKQSQLARNCGYIKLADELKRQSTEEEHHGDMLNSLADGQQRIIKQGSLGKLRVIREDGLEITKNTNSWDTFTYQGKSHLKPELDIQITYEYFDGMSERYWCLRYFFAGKQASDYGWADKLAFMAVLEDETRKFYLCLSKLAGDTPIGRVAAKIAEDEYGHSNYLMQSIQEYYFCDTPEYYINKWRSRIPVARLILILDIIRWIFKIFGAKRRGEL